MSHECDGGITRREALKRGTGTAVALAAAAHGDVPPPRTSSERMIGIQAGAVSFVDEGVDQVLDIFQEKGNINTIFLAAFTYGRGIGGRPWIQVLSATRCSRR